MTSSIVITLVILLAVGYSVHRAFFSRTSPPAPSRTTTPAEPLARLCGQAGWPEVPVDGGAYIVQNDEWNSNAPECITTNGDPQFTVTGSSIYEPASGAPGGYPSIFSGCSAGVCTVGNKMPIRVSQLKPGMITSNWVTTQPGSGAYDVAYDIWFNHTPATSGNPDAGELMIWLAHRGGDQIAPSGAPVAHVTIGSYSYTVWLWSGNPSGDARYDLISYVMNRATRSVQDFDIGAVAADAARRGYLGSTSYLLNIQAGFELWQGGSGLATKSFGISIGR